MEDMYKELAEQRLAELDNMAAVLRAYEKQSWTIYKAAAKELGEDSYTAIGSKQEHNGILDIMEELGVKPVSELERFYFTFGTCEHFPYTRGEYLVVLAQDIREAARKYKKVYPNIDEDTLNCAEYYSQKDWDKIKEKHYKDVEPKRVIE